MFTFYYIKGKAARTAGMYRNEEITSLSTRQPALCI